MKIILGTMTFGQQIFFEDALKLVNQYMKCGYKEIDTAYVYNNGDCEKILGKVIEKFRREDISVATKVNPRITGKLDGEAVEMQLTESLHRMGLEYVDILYLHFPDYNTPLDSALDMCAKLIMKVNLRNLD